MRGDTYPRRCADSGAQGVWMDGEKFFREWLPALPLELCIGTTCGHVPPRGQGVQKRPCALEVGGFLFLDYILEPGTPEFLIQWF